MNAITRAIRKSVTPIHTILRKQKVRMFFEYLNPGTGDTMLDVGGWIGSDSEFSELYSFFPIMTSINLINVEHAHADLVIGDACNLPFSSKSFDYVFSNAVIEHVGEIEKQTMMAREVQRVARKGYFVATPNRWFPIDPHSYVPFMQNLPISVRRMVNPSDDYWMLSPIQMRKLFPDARIVITKSMTSVVAVCKF